MTGAGSTGRALVPDRPNRAVMGWWVAGLVAVVACCPVTVDEPYPSLAEAVETQGVYCSWAYIGDDLAVTALHCLERVPDSPAIVETTWDAALVRVRPGLQEVPRMVAHAEVGLLDVLCYYDFRGEPNCGHVLWQTDNWIATTAETRLVHDGDSGSPLLTRTEISSGWS